ncbi:Retrovirus-related Pol polyprotein from transposon TNT 1-94-like protein [Drosera capensis]
MFTPTERQSPQRNSTVEASSSGQGRGSNTSDRGKGPWRRRGRGRVVDAEILQHVKKELDKNITGRVKFGDGSIVQVMGKGTIVFQGKNGDQYILHEVYYIPKLCTNIISLGQLTENGVEMNMVGEDMKVYDNGKLLMFVKCISNRLYKISFELAKRVCLLASLDNPAWLWHSRLGNVNFQTLKLVGDKRLAVGVPKVSHPNKLCEACLISKQIRLPFPAQMTYRAKKPLELLHADLCGPITPSTLVGATEPETVHGARASSSATRESTPSIPSSHSPVQVPKSPDSGPVRLRDLRDIYANTEEVILGDDDDELMLFESDEPICYREAATESAWYEAMQKELESIKKNKTWTLTKLPLGHKLIGLKWIFKLKKDSEGQIVKHKARLMTKVYVQRQGIDFEEVFAPVARLDTRKGLRRSTGRVRGTRPKVSGVQTVGELEEEVYVAQSEGFEVQGQKHLVYRLSKAVYGPKLAPRAWNIRLDRNLKELGFRRCSQEQAVYTRGEGSAALIVGVYVDDLIVTGGNSREVKLFKQQMMTEFETSDFETSIVLPRD